jgi:hypothetical protein
MQTITVVIRDNADPLGDPLIYSVRTLSLEHDAVMVAVRQARLEDTNQELEDLELDLLFAFNGDLSTVADWRA